MKCKKCNRKMQPEQVRGSTAIFWTCECGYIEKWLGIWDEDRRSL